jgi:hypothetical protein
VCNYLKNFKFSILEIGYNPDSHYMVVELKEIKIFKERIGWFKSEKSFELVLGKILETGNLR